MVRMRIHGMGTMLRTHGAHFHEPRPRNPSNGFPQATSFNFPGLLVARIALGVIETAMSPGVPFYMCE